MMVSDVCHENFAVPVHDPLCGCDVENYSHCEIRIRPVGLGENEDPLKKLPKGARSVRNAWRRHVILNSEIVIAAEA